MRDGEEGGDGGGFLIFAKNRCSRFVEVEVEGGRGLTNTVEGGRSLTNTMVRKFRNKMGVII